MFISTDEYIVFVIDTIVEIWTTSGPLTFCGTLGDLSQMMYSRNIRFHSWGYLHRN